MQKKNKENLKRKANANISFFFYIVEAIQILNKTIKKKLLQQRENVEWSED